MFTYNRSPIVEDDDEDQEGVIINIDEEKPKQQPKQSKQRAQPPPPTPEDPYKIFRNKHRTYNHIPLNSIEVVLRHHFPNDSSILHDYDDSAKLLRIKICDLLSSNVSNWEHNREPDFIRIPDIAKYIYESRKPVKTMFYANYNFTRDCFEIIDGIQMKLIILLPQ